MNEVARYHLAKDGGRVKSAGTPIDFVVDQGKAFVQNPGADSAVVVARTFHTLRDNPPEAIRNRFFPSDRAAIKAMTKRSPALFRSVLKTDQGAGKFLPFTIGVNGDTQSFQVSHEEGYVIPEAHFSDQMRANPSKTVEDELVAVRSSFKRGELYETFLAYERLQAESANAGLVFKREAQVGRNALMFIHPAEAKNPIVLSEDVVSRAGDHVQQMMEKLRGLTAERKKKFAETHNLPFRESDDYSEPFYAQADVHIFPDGSVRVAELQVPDVGLFLTGLPVHDNRSFASVQKIVEQLKEKVLNGFEQTILQAKSENADMPAYLVTRKEVVEDKEDVLEIGELQQVKNGLRQRGHEVNIITAEQAAGLDSDSLLFVFNLDPDSEEFGELAAAYLKDTENKLRVSPDPFYRATEREVSEYDSVDLTTSQLINFHALVKDVELFDKGHKVYTQMMALDYYFRQMGIQDDVLHFFNSKFPTPIPAYRYDVRGLHIASGIIQEQGLDNVQIRSIPISKEQGVLLDADGGTLYATFRFIIIKD